MAMICSAALAISVADRALCDEYPSKPIRLVTSLPGGSADFVARVIGQGITLSLGQPVIVENRGGGFITGQIVSRAVPDGYTLLVAPGSFWVAPFFQKAPYDPVKDFSPVVLAVVAPNVLVVHASIPAKSVKELIAIAKASPGALNYAASAPGAPNHLSAELFKSLAGINVVYVPYKSGGAAVVGLLGGEAQLMLDTGASLMPHIKSGKIRALAVTSRAQSALFPGLPPIGDTLPGYEAVAMTAVFAPAATPVRIIDRLNREIMRVLEQGSQEKFFASGSEVAGGPPAQLAAAVNADMTRWGKLIKDAGLRAD